MNKTRTAIVLIGLLGLALFFAGCPGKDNMMSHSPNTPTPTHSVG